MRSNHQIIQDHYRASDRQDLTGMMADMAPDVRWTEAEGFPCAGTHVGVPQIIARVFDVLGRDWSDYRFELETLLDAGDRQVGIGTYSGVFRATGKAMRARVAHVWTLRDAQIVGFEQFTDTLLVTRAMA